VSNLEWLLPKIQLKVKRHIDFDFIYNEVKDTYGINGNESVAPPIILKMMLLLIFYNVRSEREKVKSIYHLLRSQNFDSGNSPTSFAPLSLA
jgi:transposase